MEDRTETPTPTGRKGKTDLRAYFRPGPNAADRKRLATIRRQLDKAASFLGDVSDRYRDPDNINPDTENEVPTPAGDAAWEIRRDLRRIADQVQALIDNQPTAAIEEYEDGTVPQAEEPGGLPGLMREMAEALDPPLCDIDYEITHQVGVRNLLMSRRAVAVSSALRMLAFPGSEMFGAAREHLREFVGRMPVDYPIWVPTEERQAEEQQADGGAR